jgi:hypothetical protein
MKKDLISNETVLSHVAGIVTPSSDIDCGTREEDVLRFDRILRMKG